MSSKQGIPGRRSVSRKQTGIIGCARASSVARRSRDHTGSPQRPQRPRRQNTRVFFSVGSVPSLLNLPLLRGHLGCRCVQRQYQCPCRVLARKILAKKTRIYEFAMQICFVGRGFFATGRENLWSTKIGPLHGRCPAKASGNGRVHFAEKCRLATASCQIHGVFHGFLRALCRKGTERVRESLLFGASLQRRTPRIILASMWSPVGTSTGKYLFRTLNVYESKWT